MEKECNCNEECTCTEACADGCVCGCEHPDCKGEE